MNGTPCDSGTGTLKVSYGGQQSDGSDPVSITCVLTNPVWTLTFSINNTSANGQILVMYSNHFSCSSPAGPPCPAASFANGTTVTLTASFLNGSATLSWQGCDSVSTDTTTCTVTMNGNKNVVLTAT